MQMKGQLEHIRFYSKLYIKYCVNYQHCNDYITPNTFSRHQQDEEFLFSQVLEKVSKFLTDTT